MEKDKITPEEQLLKVIENPGLAQKRKITKEEVTVKLNGLLARFKSFRFDKDIVTRIDVQTVNKVIAGICAVITLFLIYEFAHNKIYLARRFKNIVAPPSEAVSAREQAMAINVKLEDVLTQARKHNIFTLLPSKDAAMQGPGIGGPAELKLVGVLWSDHPQAMIENTKEQKTYFVSTGDKIGVVTVKSILQNKVILTKDSEEWELR